MNPTLKNAICEALEKSEYIALTDEQKPIADAARCCVRAQLGVETPDSYVIHRCLQALYRQVRHAAPVGNDAKADFDEALAIVKSCMNATGPRVDHVYAWIAPKARLLKAVRVMQNSL